MAGLVAYLAVSGPTCPPHTSLLEASVSAEGLDWTVCEDLQTQGGAIALLPHGGGETVWLEKTFEPFMRAPDSEYYLGLDKEKVLAAKWDMLGQTILTKCASRVGEFCEPTWAHVEKAVPVIRYSRGNRNARAHNGADQWMCSPYGTETGVRTFVGSRSASVDATFSDHADDWSAPTAPPKLWG